MEGRKTKIFKKIILLGNSQVGKTSLLRNLVDGRQALGSYKPTIGSDFLTKEIVLDDKIITMQLWDTAGQERFQSLGSSFYRGADLCVLVFDVTDRMTLEQLPYWRESFLVQADPPDREHFPFVVLGNKCDEGDARVVPRRMGQAWCQTNNVAAFFETSARSGAGVQGAFVEIAKLLIAADAAEDQRRVGYGGPTGPGGRAGEPALRPVRVELAEEGAPAGGGVPAGRKAGRKGCACKG